MNKDKGVDSKTKKSLDDLYLIQSQLQNYDSQNSKVEDLLHRVNKMVKSIAVFGSVYNSKLILSVGINSILFLLIYFLFENISSLSMAEIILITFNFIAISSIFLNSIISSYLLGKIINLSEDIEALLRESREYI